MSPGCPRQMQVELVAAMEALSKAARSGAYAEAALTGASGSGEALVGQAAMLSGRISRN